MERPLLAAIRAGSGAVLLVDELDRADDEFEAFLLEVLSEFAVTIPEIGRVAAETPPAVVVTSNRTRELHDALKRRCLYHWIDHPDLEREIQIVRVRAPHVSDALARDVANAVLRLREMDLAKLPGVAETIDWANALAFLGAERLDRQIAADTLGAVVKDHEDQQLVAARIAELVRRRWLIRQRVMGIDGQAWPVRSAGRSSENSSRSSRPTPCVTSATSAPSAGPNLNA